MLGSIGSILSGAGALAGALGSGKGQTIQQSQSGFASLPKELQDYLKGDIFTRIKAYGQTPYATVPYRRIGTAETDPIFGSRALQDLQRLNDMRTMQQYVAQAPQTAAPAKSISGDTASALEFLSRARSQYLPNTRQSQMYNRIGGEDDINSLAKLLGWYKTTTGEGADSLDSIGKYVGRDPEMLKLYQGMMS